MVGLHELCVSPSLFGLKRGVRKGAGARGTEEGDGRKKLFPLEELPHALATPISSAQITINIILAPFEAILANVRSVPGGAVLPPLAGAEDPQTPLPIPQHMGVFEPQEPSGLGRGAQSWCEVYFPPSGGKQPGGRAQGGGFQTSPLSAHVSSFGRDAIYPPPSPARVRSCFIPWPEGPVPSNFPMQNADTSPPLSAPPLCCSPPAGAHRKPRRERTRRGGGAGAETNKEFKCEPIKNKIK